VPRVGAHSASARSDRSIRLHRSADGQGDRGIKARFTSFPGPGHPWPTVFLLAAWPFRRFALFFECPVAPPRPPLFVNAS
jgi:hypothetical protein